MLDWLVSLPASAFYIVLGVVAAIETFIPPFPADVVVAFGACRAAKGLRGSLAFVVGAIWLGMLIGAMVVCGAARRYGAERLEERRAGSHAESWYKRRDPLFDRYGS